MLHTILIQAIGMIAVVCYILSFQIIIISSPDIKTGETYILTVGEETAEFEAN